MAAKAPGQGQGMAMAGCNYVGADEIWKAHVRQEVTASKKWPENWDFMTTSYDKIMEEEPQTQEEEGGGEVNTDDNQELVENDFPKKQRTKLLPPTPIRLPPITPIDKRVTVLPTNKPIPRRSSDMIGWRSADPAFRLEVYGKYANPKGGLVKQLNWPTEAIE